MKISEKQIYTMIMYLTQVMDGYTGEDYCVVTLTKKGSQDIRDLLNEIINQQSEELKDIK